VFYHSDTLAGIAVVDAGQNSLTFLSWQPWLAQNISGVFSVGSDSIVHANCSMLFCETEEMLQAASGEFLPVYHQQATLVPHDSTERELAKALGYLPEFQR